MRRPIALLPLALLLFAGCGTDMENETYVAVIVAKTSYMLEEGLSAEDALEKAAADNGVTPDEVSRFEDSLANDPERLAAVVELIMNESEELRQKFAELYSQALPTVEPPAGEAPAEPSEESP